MSGPGWLPSGAASGRTFSFTHGFGGGAWAYALETAWLAPEPGLFELLLQRAIEEPFGKEAGPPLTTQVLAFAGEEANHLAIPRDRGGGR